MPLEAASFIADLVATNPTGSDQKLQGDDHIRLIKSVLQASFPNIDAEVTASPDDLNLWTGSFGGLVAGNYFRAFDTDSIQQRTPAEARTDLGADNATNLTTGTLPDARLSSNIPRKDTAATITATYTFSGGAVVLDPGTESLPMLRMSGDGDTGLFQVSTTNSWGMAIGGEEQIRYASGGIPIRIAGRDSTDAVRLGFFTADQATERGYVGYPTASSDLMFIRNIVGTEIVFRCADNVSRLYVNDTIGVGVIPVSGPSSVEVGYRQIVRQTTGGTLTAAMVGTCQAVSSAVTVNNSVFAAGDAVQIYNNSASAINITKGTITNLRLSGSATDGTRSLAQRGLALLWFNSATECVVSGDVT